MWEDHLSWQVQEAKQRFSEVLRAVEKDGPQTITRHGEEVAVVVDIVEYRRPAGHEHLSTTCSISPRLIRRPTAGLMCSTRSRRNARTTSRGTSISGRTSDLPRGHERAVRAAQACTRRGRDRLVCPDRTGRDTHQCDHRGEIRRGITRLELRRDLRQAARYEKWLSATVRQFAERIIPVTTDAAQRWGHQDTRRPTPTADGLIGATAAAHGWTLVTRNTKDFDHLDVDLLNPFTG